uniref:CFA20 domain-containing protein n=1 Tax=Gadus morhua TaxID=8049 RepID=A0A8C4ZPU6_GADMO
MTSIFPRQPDPRSQIPTKGGAVVEVFSAQGNNPVAKWKLQGAPASIKKIFDKEVKGFVYCVEGSSQTVKMLIPEDGKTTLGLLQRFLVLQVNIPECRDFSIELIISDSTHLKKRLYFSTVHKEFSATPLHARIPFVSLKQNIWSNLCIDLVSFTAELFKTAVFRTLDSIAVCANCKIRRIFTMKTEATDTSDGGGKCGDSLFSELGLGEVIPRSCRFPQDVCHVTQVFSMEGARQTAATKLLNSDSGRHSSPASAGGSAVPRKHSSASHVAFGTRVSRPPPPLPPPHPQHARKRSRSREEMHARGSELSLLPSQGQAARDISVRLSDATPCDTKNAFEDEVTGRTGGLQPLPPQDRALGRQKLRLPTAGWKKTLSSATGTGPAARAVLRGEAGERAGRPPSEPGGSGQPLTQADEMRGLQTAG